MLRIKSLRWLLLALIYWAGIGSLCAAVDTRILIDVSGSMKKNDPKNLRVSALKLLNGLLPTGSNAGVWYFGRYVDMSVDWGKVDKAWRIRADKGAEQLHSNGLFTNIESALERSTQGWLKPEKKTTRNVILLTDGKVDVSKDADKNLKSRQKILSTGIAKLKSQGARVYSIALSKNADTALLKRLSLETGGFFESVNDAQTLQRVFFSMFEKATSPDTLQIDGNQFKVDKNIREMTLLVFNKATSKPSTLYPPSSDAITALNPGKATWRSEDGYDLVTINKPAPGVWKMDAEIDPDNRLMIVTDLKLKAKGLPVYAAPDSELELIAELYNNDKLISKNSFLRFVKFSVEHVGPNGDTKTSEMEATKVRKNKGRYLYPLPEIIEEGYHELIITADSRTFSRSQRLTIEVQWPVMVDIETTAKAGDYQLSILPREEYLKPDSLSLEVELHAPDGTKLPITMQLKDLQWTQLIETEQNGMYSLSIVVNATDQSEVEQRYNLGKYSILGVYREPPKSEANSSLDAEGTTDSDEP
ncbi:MAG: hypothetical protein ACI8XC_001773, partial [Gammaproteobacteria bacterium]